MKNIIYAKPIAFQRVFVELTGSITSALLLSQAVYWSQRTKSDDGWFYKTQEEWEDETGMTRYELDNAKKKCERYLKVELRGIPAKNYYFVDFEALDTDCGISANKFVENQQTSLGKTSKHSITENTTENTFTEKKLEIHPYLQFPLPEDWSDESYVDSEGGQIWHFTDENGVRVPQREINRRKGQFQANKRGLETRQETHSEFNKQALKNLREVQGVFKLDGGDNYKHGAEVEEKFKKYMETEFDMSDLSEDEYIRQFKLFLERAKKHPFHGKNMTSMGYINRNFNKIVREI